MHRTTRAVVGAVALAVLGTTMTTTTAAAQAAESGQVRLRLAAPEGVPFNVGLDDAATRSLDHVVGKAPSGTSTVTTLAVPSGAYHVQLPPVTVDGVRYVGSSSRPEVVVRAGQTSPLEVTYVAEEGARRLRATGLTATSLSFAWDAADGSRFSLRRSDDGKPVGQRNQGVEVPVDGTTARDTGLQPGGRYAYSLFTQRNSRWYGPLTVTAGTEAPAGSSDATYVAAPTTLLAKAADVVSAVATGEGVAVVLAEGVPTPLLGAAVVLPISPALEGGYLGVVQGLSADGRSLLLTAGAISDAFDYYALDVKTFAAGYPEGTPPVGDGEVTAGSQESAKSSLKAAAAPKAVCGGGSGGMDVVFNPGVDLGGHYRTVVDKYSFFGKDIPVGASLDLGVSTTVTGAASVRANAVLKCKLDLGKVFHHLSFAPVPLSVYLAPVAEFGVGGALEVQNLGFRTTAGFNVQGSFSLKDGADVGGDRYAKTEELTPTIIKNGLVQLKVGGEFLVGPGIGTTKAGVIAGVGGELLPIDASFAPGFAENDERRNFCTVVKGAATFQLFLGVKALLGKWSFSQKFTIEALKGRAEYPGSPYYFPDKCLEFPAEETPDSLLGDGVEQVEDKVEGTDEQWDHVTGFAPGESTWVLSTGRVADALGEPSDFASTGLGTPGSAELTALSGRPTYDAASYVVTLKPKGDTLHVDYVFASEEYPEYVGSGFNDVMAVFVDGKNCATVPGTGQAVSINTVNQFTNSQYYVDNSAGAGGYGTSMDGLTVPLTCTVPVTPGQPVTVRIAVADASDSAFDSAVALIDGGIYSD